jgi:Fe-S-cluster containining protein
MLDSNSKPDSTLDRAFYAQGLRFSCARCSACCRHEEGFVFLSGKDASLLGEALNMEFQEFTKAFCRWVPAADGIDKLSLKEKSNFDCIFWKQNGCSVYEARPLQCRAFPFWHSVLSSKANWNLTAKSCPGIGQGTLHSRDYIKKWLAIRQKEPIISRSILN